ncbi:hypothetical protein MSG37_02645 [Shewanella sp. 1CM18E]|uniref:hypothetical protein n=1 Tax=Shewanella sp. 1CM18E TaxID=2929169 RepID=UPI0020C0DDD5|nr:hypothetical protein [Shewanella sp. 1CM18E]MCK8043770.1 hypothetical protein [Shewanella sp. 1CM18E]
MSTNFNNGPQVNVDGTPMVADSGVDIKGNPYGVTDSSMDTGTPSPDSTSDSSFDDSSDCSYDSSYDSFSSGFDDF